MEKCLFEAGLDVWSITYGWGKVMSIEEGLKYPVVVEYTNRILGKVVIHYSKEGKQYEAENRTLFFEEIVIPQSALEKPRKTAEQMLDDCEEMEFVAGERNLCLYFSMREERVKCSSNIQDKHLGVKYISEEDAEMIVRECKENNK